MCRSKVQATQETEADSRSIKRCKETSQKIPYVTEWDRCQQMIMRKNLLSAYVPVKQYNEKKCGEKFLMPSLFTAMKYVTGETHFITH